jgi:hypothetical protein
MKTTSPLCRKRLSCCENNCLSSRYNGNASVRSLGNDVSELSPLIRLSGIPSQYVLVQQTQGKRVVLVPYPGSNRGTGKENSIKNDPLRNHRVHKKIWTTAAPKHDVA